MKYYLFGIIVLFSLNAMAQSDLKMVAQPAWLNGVSLDSARALADSFVSISHNKYVFKSTGGAQNKMAFFYSRVDGDSKNEALLGFEKKVEGEDADKNIPGVTKYYVDFYGLFEDIFPFWKRYVDPNADANKILDRKYDTQKFIVRPEPNGFHLTANLRMVGDDVWSIVVR